MPTLYITEPGAQLGREYQRLLVRKQDRVLFAVPVARVGHVVLVGNVNVTTPALHMLLAHDVDLSLLNRSGKLLGRLTSPRPKNLALRHAQYQRSQDPDFCLAVSRDIVEGKLRNYRVLTQRAERNGHTIPPGQLERLTAAMANASAAPPSLASLRGIEGNGTKAWFAILRSILQHDLGFRQRNRRPPKDPINAMLSLGYTMMNINLMAACEIAGLDPYDGFFHSDAYGRPALALDLIEEFRGPFVDSFVLNLVNREMIGPDDFIFLKEEGCRLTHRGLRVFFQRLNTHMQGSIFHPVADRKLSRQKCLEVQCRLLRKVIEGKELNYRPFSIR